MGTVGSIRMRQWLRRKLAGIAETEQDVPAGGARGLKGLFAGRTGVLWAQVLAASPIFDGPPRSADPAAPRAVSAEVRDSGRGPGVWLKS